MVPHANEPDEIENEQKKRELLTDIEKACSKSARFQKLTSISK